MYNMTFNIALLHSNLTLSADTPIFPYIHQKLFCTVLSRFCWTGEMVSKEEIISERDQSDPFKVRCILNKKSIMSYLTAHLSRGKGVWTSCYDI